MLNLEAPELRWGVAGWGTKITGRLYTEEIFTFRKDAQEYIDKTNAFFSSEGRPTSDDDMFPVLLSISTSICSDEETRAYDTEQVEWLERHGQAAKRRREQADNT